MFFLLLVQISKFMFTSQIIHCNFPIYIILVLLRKINNLQIIKNTALFDILFKLITDFLI